MRLVVDTNVFISAALKENSWPAETVRWISRLDGLLKSTVTEQELMAVIQRPRLAGKILQLFIDELRNLLATAEHVVVSERISACRDPADDKFLELAVSGRADVIISGDADLLTLDRFRGIPIITAAAFCRTRA